MTLPVDWRDHPFAYVTTKGRRSGRPHRIEIWFVVENGSGWLLTERAPETDWVANVRADPAVTVEIGDWSLRLRAEVVETEPDHAARLALAERYAPGDPELREWAQGALAVRVSETQPPAGAGDVDVDARGVAERKGRSAEQDAWPPAPPPRR